MNFTLLRDDVEVLMNFILLRDDVEVLMNFVIIKNISKLIKKIKYLFEILLIVLKKKMLLTFKILSQMMSILKINVDDKKIMWSKIENITWKTRKK